jgi:cytochrome c5
MQPEMKKTANLFPRGIRRKTIIFLLVGIISLLLGYKTKQFFSSDEEIIVEMQALPAPLPQQPNTPNDRSIYEAHCAGCHDTGAAGAPKLGDKPTWATRITKGIPILLQHVSQGYNLMPPRGTCLQCSDADLEAATTYLVKKSK